MNKAFTLAEVLITLGIIGIVAAMTLPALIQNYQKYVLKNQFKKAYSTILSSINKTHADLGVIPACYYSDNGDLDGSVVYGCHEFAKALKLNLNVTKECDGDAYKDGCIPEYKGIEEVYQENNPDDNSDKEYTGCIGYTKNYIKQKALTWVLADGTIIFFYTWAKDVQMPLFAIDVNGMKKPNKWGYDLFDFKITTHKSSKNLKITGGGACMYSEKGGISTSKMIKELYD